jgi:hypothetical protein
LPEQPGLVVSLKAKFDLSIKMTNAPLSNAIRVHWISGKRIPELCGVLWLALLAGAIWTHTHFTTQAPIYDSFTYYMKAYNFWEAVRAGRWFNPLNLEPTLRPPGTVLMSYPFGFDPDPRSFYFRSVYFPNCLIFASVLIAAYRKEDDIKARFRTILTAIFFTTITLAYHFEFGGETFGYWGLVDSFLTGLAALAAACVSRGARIEARMWAWAVAVSLVSATSILVKPSGTLVAAIAGLAWIAFALGELAGYGVSDKERWSLAFRFFCGAALIALTDAAVVAAALSSRYLSRENLAYGRGSVAILKAEFRLPLSQYWPVLNSGLGGAFLLWGGLAAMICTWAFFSHGSVVARHGIALAVSFAALATGVWFWFVIAGGGTQIRYVVPFFVMGMIWLVPLILRASQFVPLLLELSMSGVMVAATLNLVLVLLVPAPSQTWQEFAGVNVTANFPPETLASFSRLVAQSSGRAAHVYIVSFDDNDAVLTSMVTQKWLLDHDSQPLLLQRPIDWQRSSAIRVAEIGAADMLLINPRQARAFPAGQKVNNLSEEQGVFTAWANKLDVSDGISVFFSAPSAKILTVTDRVSFRESLRQLVARYRWDSTFTEANNLSQL